MYQPSRTVQYKCEMGHHRITSITYHVDLSTVLEIKREHVFTWKRALSALKYLVDVGAAE